MTWSFNLLFFGGIVLAGMSIGLYLSRSRFSWKNSFPLWLHISVYVSAFLTYTGTLVRYVELSATESPFGFAFFAVIVTMFLTVVSTMLFFGTFCGINRLVAKYHRFANE